MLSIKARNKIFSRLVNLCDGKITPLRINKLTNEQIKSIGTANSKVTYIRSIIDAVLNNELDFASLKEMNDSDVFKYLTSFNGIRKWTANMYLIFVLNRLDILPTNDAAFLQSYNFIKQLIFQKQQYKIDVKNGNLTFLLHLGICIVH